MYDYVRSYRTARVYFTIMEVIGWLSVVSGIITFLAGLTNIGGRSAEAVFGLALISSGVLLVFTGLGLIVFIQTSRAVVDNAETSVLNLTLATCFL